MNYQPKYKFRSYNFKGMRLNKIMNSHFVSLKRRVKTQSPKNVLSDQFNKPFGFFRSKSAMFSIIPDNYSLKKYDFTREKYHLFTRSYNSVKSERIILSTKFAKGKNELIEVAKIQNELDKIHKEYRTDIVKILGIHKDHFLIQTVSEHGVLVDVLSKDLKKLLVVLKIELNKKDDVNEVYFFNDSIFIVIENNEDGLQIFKYNIPEI